MLTEGFNSPAAAAGLLVKTAVQGPLDIMQGCSELGSLMILT
jgi:hypothetical protein